MNIPITKPYFTERERELLLKPLETGWVVQGPYVSQFQDAFAAFTGSAYARATTNCTSALHLSLLALGIGRGDQVVVPSFTYVATANSVEAVGATPIFCDVDVRTFCMDPLKLEKILERDSARNIKALMPVNQFGLCADLQTIRELADVYHLKMVEDCACSFGSTINGQHSGTFGHTGCFSFHPRKTISTGEGGMVITDDEELAARVVSLRDHGASKSDRERHGQKGSFFLPDFNVVGHNFRNKALSALPQLITPYIPAGYISGYQSYVCLFATEEELGTLSMDLIDELHTRRNAFMYALEKDGVTTRQGTHAIHTLGYYKNTYDLKDDQYLNSYAADRLSVSLPLYYGMTDEELEYVLSTIQKYL